MKTIQAKPRKRINKFVRILSKIYNVSYSVVNAYYLQFNKCVQLTKWKLEQIARAEAELSIIN